MDTLVRVAAGLAAPQHVSVRAALGTEGAAAVGDIVAARAMQTQANGRRAALLVHSFVLLNAALLRDLSAGHQDALDLALEAFVAARAAPQLVPAWDRPPSWPPASRPTSVGAESSAVRGALAALGYGGSFPRTARVERALGCRDSRDQRPTEQIFAWEVAATLRTLDTRGAWEQCAAAMVSISLLLGPRRKTSTNLLLEQVTQLSGDTVSVCPLVRPKPVRERAQRRACPRAQPVILRHWLVQRAVIPWLDAWRASGVAGTALLFPSLVRPAPRVARSPQGFVWRWLWCEPQRTWSDRARRDALQLCVPARGTRVMHGLRAGANTELRRSAAVSDVVRRTLQGRSVRQWLRGEDPYAEVFGEDFADATQRLGRLRIERRGGLLWCTATSASCGAHDDWVATSAIPVDPEPLCDATSSDDDGCRFACGRCGRWLRADDYGFMCEGSADCPWGVCPNCNPGGARTRAPLLCPHHTAARRRAGPDTNDRTSSPHRPSDDGA